VKRLVVTITIPDVDVLKLKEQRDANLRSICAEENYPLPDEDDIERLKMLDAMLTSMIEIADEKEVT